MKKFVKNGLTMEINPMFEKMYVDQGWTPVVEVTESIEAELYTMNSTLHDVVIDENWDDDNSDDENSITEHDELPGSPKYTNRTITRMTKGDILSLAKECGYTITSTNKTDIVNEFLLRQSEKQ